ncbi:DNA alkylation repair protein [Patescibacteria group bacterium]|nr:DNA alkylation repair protein [Patescibacteria group bacterium]
MLKQIIKELQRHADKQRAAHSLRFFKTGPGEYGEGDKFLGITTPIERKIAKKYYKSISIDEVQILLSNRFHDIRMTALFILILKNKKAVEKTKKEYFDFYLKNTKYINNWDLVDVTCRDIIGEYLVGKDRKILYRLSKSKNLWERRISIISTFAFIKRNDFNDGLKIAEILVNDKHGLIQKAVGWTLREIGKKDFSREEKFLSKYYKVMGRTALRYAIEKFPEAKRKFYLTKSKSV